MNYGTQRSVRSPPSKDFWSIFEIPVRELAELAFANWIAARSLSVRMSASIANGILSPNRTP